MARLSAHTEVANMAWDDLHQTASDPSNPTDDEQLTADEWNSHVTDQKHRSVTSFVDSQQQVEQQTPPKPEFTKSSNNPIFQGGNTDWGTSNQANWPTYFQAGEVLSNPLGEHYIYYSKHDDVGVGLLYADTVDGTWTDHGRIINSSDAIENMAVWDRQNDQIRLYTNGGPDNNINLWLQDDTDDNGTSFTFNAEVYRMGVHSGYPKLFQHGDKWYMYQYHYEQDSSMRVLMYSPTGTQKDWVYTEVSPGYRDKPTGDNTQSTIQWSSYTILPYFDGYLMAWRKRSGVSTAEIHVGYTTDGLNIHDWGLAIEPTETYEDTHVSDPHLFYAEDRLYMVYACADGGNGETESYALAYDDLGWIS